MNQDPLIIYSSLIPGGLHYISGGFDPPAQKRIRPRDLPPEPLSSSSTLATNSTGPVRTGLRKIKCRPLLPCCRPGPTRCCGGASSC